MRIYGTIFYKMGSEKMFCEKCGKEVKKDNRYCWNCGSVLDKQKVENASHISTENNQSMQSKQENKIANLLCILSLIFGFGSGIIEIFFLDLIKNESIVNTINNIIGIFPLIGLVLMIVARVKYPKSIFAKVLMWIYIIVISLCVTAFIVIAMACAIACDNGF